MLLYVLAPKYDVIMLFLGLTDVETLSLLKCFRDAASYVPLVDI